MIAEHRGSIACLGIVMMIAAGCVRPATGPTKAPEGAPGVAPPAAQDVADAESDAHALQSKVTRVTVYSDRARVTRQATAQVPGEPTVFAFRSLPGWVDDGSVQVAASAGRIVDVRVDRRFLAKATDASWRQVESEHKALADKLAAQKDELAVLDAQKAQIEAIKAFSLAKITQDTLIGDISVKSYGDVVQFISDSLRATAKARRAVQSRLDELSPEYEASLRRVEDAKGLMDLEETTVLVTLQASSPTPASVELTYMLPGVTWEPMHELRASTTDAKSVEVISFAAVTQTSGEDWGGAELSFSTQSTTQSVRIPELEALTLGDTQSATRILTSQVSSFTRAQAAFEGQSQLWNKVHQGASAERARSNFEQVYRSNIEYLQVVQGRTVSIFESLEKRGTTAHFKAQKAQSVRGDGHPVRLLIGRSVLESAQKTVAAPEQSLNAAHTLAMTNSTGQPFLPGKVARYQDGTFLGMTDIDFIAKGERFSLFLSVADHLKLSRQLDRKLSNLVRKTRSQMQVMFIVTVENLSSEETSFTLADRIPVSENKDIHIDKVSITPATKPDSQGLLHWDLSLKPGAKREFRIGYQVEYPPELVLETTRRRMKAASPANPSAAYPSPSPAPSRSKIEDQILDLEAQF
ncbi:MAG: mucoidy inhibitor MuiA family protein [Nannocystis sp.]|uniref:mucoidy inhibitor MuiA family protein n=1 Tax=Nannocystis sp. TaxID=1962667 RepID=UPI002427FE2E|nr:mucoidy inhibitor MuiA family protein [Nannocystis sp.]MBK9752063.1 mucoidy inhibitor MuiA family protein [Nannocystis sp.]